MRLGRRAVLAAGAWVACAQAANEAAHAAANAAGQGEKTLRYVTPGVVNTLDPVMLGATGEATALGAATYDRLVRFGRVPTSGGDFVFDGNAIEGELAERFQVAPDARSIAFHLKPGATWHDGTAVTAEDVKWSLDRAVGAPSMAKAQLATGAMTEPGQFAVVSDGLVEVRLPRPDALALPNLASLFAPMFNSALARRHATEADPWATGWLAQNTAGGGAYTVERFTPGQGVVLARNEAWRGGPAPFFRRAAVQTVPEASTRAALMERGDAELATGLQAQDVARFAGGGDVRMVSTPMPTGFVALVFGTQVPPFDRVEVRRALSLAVPYEAMFTAAALKRGERLFGAEWEAPPGPGFPQRMPLHTDLGAARRGLAAAGLGGGLETVVTFAASRAAWAEPAAALLQESFGKVGVRLRVDKLPDAAMAQAMTERRLPLLLERTFALFPSTPYFFRVFLNGTSRWNLPGWRDQVVAQALAAAQEPGDAEAISVRLVEELAREVPMAMLWRPTYDVATAKGITGFTTTYDYYPDLRDPRGTA